MISVIRGRLLMSAGFCGVALVIGYLTIVNMAWGHWVDNAAYFGRQVMSRTVVTYDHRILSAVSIPLLAMAVVAILLVGIVRRCLPAALMVALGFGGAIAGAEVIKRMLPWHSLIPNDALLPMDLQHDTYPSGHATIGTSLAIAVILVSSARLRPWLAILAGFVSASFASGVLFAGWHRPSDALGGIAWSGLCMSLTAVAMVTFSGRTVRPGSHASRILLLTNLLAALLVGVTAWLAATGAGDNFPDADTPFLILTSLIILASFLVTAWFGWLLRDIDWMRHQRP